MEPQPRLHVTSELHLAVCRRDLPAVNCILGKGVPIDSENEYGQTPLHLAVHYDSLKAVCALIDFNAKIEEKDLQGQTPLHVAARVGALKIMAVLLNCGADVDATDNLNLTPLYYCAKYNNEATIQLLLEHEANIEARSTMGDTPLSIAIQYNHFNVKALLEAGANPNNEGSLSSFPIHLSVISNCLHCVNLLINFNACLTVLDVSGQTALNIATKMSRDAIMRTLIRSGGIDI